MRKIHRDKFFHDRRLDTILVSRRVLFQDRHRNSRIVERHYRLHLLKNFGARLAVDVDCRSNFIDVAFKALAQHIDLADEAAAPRINFVELEHEILRQRPRVDERPDYLLDRSTPRISQRAFAIDAQPLDRDLLRRRHVERAERDQPRHRQRPYKFSHQQRLLNRRPSSPTAIFLASSH